MCVFSNFGNNLNMNNLKNLLKSIKIPQIVDFILTNVALFFIIFAWTKYIFKNNIFAVLATTFALLIGWNIVYFSIKIAKKTPIFSTDDAEQWAQFVLTQDEKDNLNFLIGLYQKDKIYSDISNNIHQNLKGIDVLSRNLFLLHNNIGVGFDFLESDLNLMRALKIVRFAKERKITKLAIFCANVDPTSKNYLENLKDIEVVICDKNYLALKAKKMGLSTPNIFQEKPHSKLKLKEILSLSITREKAKKYFLSGLLVFFCSFFVRYNIYYILMSSLLFLLAILSIKQKNQPIKKGFWE